MNQRRPWVSWVGQEDAKGCGVAVIAMLTGRSYADIRAQIGSEVGHGRPVGADWNEHGIIEVTIDRYLQNAGYYMRERFCGYYEPDVLNEHVVIGGPPYEGGWPPPPFAPLHYAKIKQPSGNWHFVVMLDDGAVLDPLDGPNRRRLTDWPQVSKVVGLVRP